MDGIRDSKTVDGVLHEYVMLDGKVVRETYGNNTIDYFYDNDGRPHKIVVDENGTSYVGYYALRYRGYYYDSDLGLYYLENIIFILCILAGIVLKRT